MLQSWLPCALMPSQSGSTPQRELGTFAPPALNLSSASTRDIQSTREVRSLQCVVTTSRPYRFIEQGCSPTRRCLVPLWETAVRERRVRATARARQGGDSPVAFLSYKHSYIKCGRHS